MFTKMILSILAFLLLIFPNSVNLRADYQKRTFNMDASVSAVMDAIKAKDIDVLEAMMCKNIKQNVSDLRGEIGKLIDAIDGDIVSVSPWSRAYTSSTIDAKKQLFLQSIDLVFVTPEKEYKLGIMWGIVDTATPEERGIRSIALADLALYPSDGYLVAKISATENY